ncbi:hypothetical protein [Caulobacter sp. Root1472]|uniref:hypothetical protein n=1 Tax=Caulobacter sp. Root1472 TaxID=1736470 RepID=UPI0006F7488F|nr:hypothetical protein [Caulobacter sp. Root1472]KQZ33816.1 hypothetical protein ASD47_01715 [Caulobacter sp. Root1472]
MRWGTSVIVVGCLLFVGVILIPTGVWPVVWSMIFGDKAADWVQAVGSIGAILAAWFLGQRQAAHERRLESERRQVEAEQEQKRVDTFNRRGLDAMMFAYDVVNNVGRDLKRATAERPLDVVQIRRWIANADDQMAFHADRPRDWSDLTLSLYAARRHIPPIVAAMDAYRGDAETSDSLMAVLKAAVRAMRSNINYLEPDKDYVPVHGGLIPKYLPPWPTGDDKPIA